MLPRRVTKLEDHWTIDPELPYCQAIRCGKMVFITGQVDLDDQDHPVHADLKGQARATMQSVEKVLEASGLALSDLVRLTGFYVNDGHVDEDALCAEIGACLGSFPGPGPVINLVPLKALGFPGLLIEIEGLAMRGENGELLRRTAAWDPEIAAPAAPFSQALRVGEMIFTSGIGMRNRDGSITAPGNLTAQSAPVMARIDGLLQQLGADLNDTVKTMIYNAEPGKAEDWAEPALIRASHYREPGPAATGISVPKLWPEGLMVKNEVTAMRGVDGSRMPRRHVWPDNHWDWTVHLPYRHGIRCGDLVFLGGQVPLAADAAVLHAGDRGAQTRAAMDYIGRVLDEFGLTFDHVVKVNAFFSGGPDPAWKENLYARFSYFNQPGPCTTGIPVPYLAYEAMDIEIDIVAMV